LKYKLKQKREDMVFYTYYFFTLTGACLAFWARAMLLFFKDEHG